jgi:arginase family enzyme
MSVQSEDSITKMNVVSDDERTGDVLVATQEYFGDVTLIGFPHDFGVKRNGGRPGAAKGPSTLRA